MTEPEHLVTLLLSAIARLEVQLAEKILELSRTAPMTDFSSEVAVREFNWNDEERRQLAVTGYMEGEMRGLGCLAWHFQISRDGGGWSIERELTLNAEETGYQEPLYELPVEAFPDSEALVASLPLLMSDLLALRPADRGAT